LEGKPAAGKVGSHVTSGFARVMLRHLNSDLEHVSKKGGGARYKLRKELVSSIRLNACHAAARTALNRLDRGTTLNVLALAIAEAVEDTIKWNLWRKPRVGGPSAKAEEQKFWRALSHHNFSAVRAFLARREAAVAAHRSEKWEGQDRTHIGGLFVAYLEAAGLVVKAQVSEKGRRAAWKVSLTAKGDGIYQTAAETLIARARSHPMIIRPLDWTDTSGGGFLCSGASYGGSPGLPKGLQPLPLVRFDHEQGTTLETKLKAADLSTVYAGLNALQRSAWHVNRGVLRVVETLAAREEEIPGITTSEPAIPDNLSDEDAADPQKLSESKAKKAEAYSDREAARSRRRAQATALSTASKYARYPAIYFAHNVDFRGRAYPVSDALSPQGDDLQRGLLEFSTGEPLTREGVGWLQVRLANCWGHGEDKKPFPERRAWTEGNLTAIRAAARKPYDRDSLWRSADDPCQFLAACFAWKAFEDDPKSECRLPVYLDGSCSGLQHWSAVIGDRGTAEAVNVLPANAPRDLYREVAEETVRRLQASADPWARVWLNWNKIDRKILKGAVMVLPYGATKQGQPRRLLDAVKERMRKEKSEPFWKDHKEAWSAARFLSDVVWEVMTRVLARPVEAMEWTKNIVRAVKAKNARVAWTAPSGLPVVLDYRKPDAGQPVRPYSDAWKAPPTLRHYQLSERIDWKKTINSVSPNFIHSLDASHLLQSLKRAREEGVRNLAAVHDAFATTPNKTGKLHRVLREEFAALYATCDAHLALLSQNAPNVPPGKTFNEFKPQAIASSEYLFS